MKINVLAMMSLAMMALAGCQRGTGETMSTVTMRLGGQAFTLEVADNDATRQKGLMFRNSLPEGRGMIFVFDDEERRGFYMKNVPFPLDIVFLDSGGKVVSIRQMEPFDESTVSSLFPARYAIELNKGMAGRLGLKAGDVLALPEGIGGSAGRGVK